MESGECGSGGGERGGFGLDGDAKVVIAGCEGVKLLPNLVNLIRRELRVEDQVLELQRVGARSSIAVPREADFLLTFCRAPTWCLLTASSGWRMA